MVARLPKNFLIEYPEYSGHIENAFFNLFENSVTQDRK